MKKTFRLKNLWFFLIIIVTLVVMGIHVGQAQVEIMGKSDKPPKPPKPGTIPKLDIEDLNITTWDFSETLRIWHRDGSDYGFTDENKWYKSSCDYNSLTFGDANNDGQDDLVIAGPYRAGKGKNKAWYVKFEVYEDGAESDPHFASEDVSAGQWYWESEVRVCDLDADATNGYEVVLMTSRILSIFRLTKSGQSTSSELLFSYDNNDISTFLDMDVADLDGDSTPEIVIGTKKGFIRIFKYNGTTWKSTDTAPLGPDPYLDYTRIREVKTVDLDGAYPLEILCSTDDYGDPEAYSDAYFPHLHVWERDDSGQYVHVGYQAVQGIDSNTWIYFDAANLDSDPNAEVVLGTFCNYPSEMFQVWRWNNEGNPFDPIYTYLTSPQVRTRTVSISPVYGDGLQVVISGSNYPENDKDSEIFYLEVFDWDESSLISRWHAEKTYPTCRHHGIG